MIEGFFNVWFFCSQHIFVHSWYTHFHSVLFAVNKKRGLVQLLYSVQALVFGASHSGAGLMGGRFRCLKYWVTCWGSSARTDLASVSLGAWQRTRAREHHMNPDKHLEYWWLLSLLWQHRETSQVLPWADVCAMSPQSFSFLQFESQRLCSHIYKTQRKPTWNACLCTNEAIYCTVCMLNYILI